MAEWPEAPPEFPFKYWAFISYSHQDEVWASWLHRSLESYRIPRRLIGRRVARGTISKRLFPVFRDREELPGATNLTEKIVDALRQSRCLIVVCSPRSAASPWVNEEIRRFKLLGGSDRVLCLIIDGEPNAGVRLGVSDSECFPLTIRQSIDADGQLLEGHIDPIAADARPNKDGRRNALLKLIAGMIEVGFDDLRQREKRRRVVRRLSWSATATAGLLLSVLAYGLAADGGIAVPWHREIRDALDQQNASLLRPVHARQRVAEAARGLRQEMVGQIFEKWRRGNLLRPDGKYDLWFTAQALTPILRSPDLPSHDLKQAAEILQTAVLGTPRLERNGIAYGWTSQELDYSQAEATFWTLSAIAQAYRRRDQLPSALREALPQMFQRALETASVFYPIDSGGWNMFPQQVRPAIHSEYASTLALAALLDMRQAGLAWEGSEQRRDELIERTARWLMTQYVQHPGQSGWLGFKDLQTDYVLEGLTLQIYSTLLRACAETGFKLPDQMLKDMVGYLSRMPGRAFNPNHMAANIRLSFTTPAGHIQSVYYPLKFLWYPWAVETGQRWLQLASTHPRPQVEVTQVQRALGYLVVDLGREVPEQVRREFPWMAAEILHALAAVEPPVNTVTTLRPSTERADTTIE